MNLFMMLYEWFQSWRMGNALRAEIDASRCVACDSDDLHLVADEAYRCRACGYEGGPGWARMQKDRAKAKAAALPPAQRKAEALAFLKDARVLLLGARGSMKGARAASHHDLIGIGNDPMGMGDESQEKWGRVNNAMQDVGEARQLVEKAAMRLQGGVPGFEADDPVVGAAVLDRHVDGPLVNLMAHSRIDEMAGHVEGLLGAVEAAIQRLEGAEAG